MTEQLEHRLRSWLKVANFDDILRVLLLVCQEAATQGRLRGYTRELGSEPDD